MGKDAHLTILNPSVVLGGFSSRIRMEFHPTIRPVVELHTGFGITLPALDLWEMLPPLAPLYGGYGG